MRQLFESATLRLTGWYLIILACISLLFSIMVYQIATGEVERRLTRYQDKSWSLVQPMPDTITFDKVRSGELAESRAAIVGILVYMNIIILAGGGALSYLLAKRTLRSIEEAHDTQTRFVSDASHELRTPLATMTTELEVALKDTSLKKSEMREILTSNLEEVQRLTQLSDTLLALSASDSRALPQVPFNLADVLHVLAKRYNRTNETLQLALPNDVLTVIGHRASIEELLQTLIDNGQKYGAPDTPIVIHVAKRAGKLRIDVCNQGEPIAIHDLPHIFERFYRADSARTGSNGYGLGLSLAKQIATVHGTVIDVSSSAKSTTFSFFLHVAQKSKKHS